MDFVADTKAAKKNARTMIRMTQAINKDELPHLIERLEPNVRVSCATCHRGVTRDVSLSEAANAVHETGNTPDAIKLLELNVELLPDSWFGHWRLEALKKKAAEASKP